MYGSDKCYPIEQRTHTTTATAGPQSKVPTIDPGSRQCASPCQFRVACAPCVGTRRGWRVPSPRTIRRSAIRSVAFIVILLMMRTLTRGGSADPILGCDDSTLESCRWNGMGSSTQKALIDGINSWYLRFNIEIMPLGEMELTSHKTGSFETSTTLEH